MAYAKSFLLLLFVTLCPFYSIEATTKMGYFHLMGLTILKGDIKIYNYDDQDSSHIDYIYENSFNIEVLSHSDRTLNDDLIAHHCHEMATLSEQYGVEEVVLLFRHLLHWK